MRNVMIAMVVVFFASAAAAKDSITPIGINAGWNNADHGQFGFELSKVGLKLFEGSGGGGIAGGYCDFVNGGELRRFSAGPEILLINNGIIPIVDGEYAMIFKEGKRYNGIAARITLLFGKEYIWLPAMPYYRFTKVFGSNSIKECGVLVKFPFDMFN